MKKKYLFLGALWLVGCVGVNKSAKKRHVDGFYQEKTISGKKQVYIDVVEDDLMIYETRKDSAGKLKVDTISGTRIISPEIEAENNMVAQFRKPSFDIDFLTIPLKLRPNAGNVPVQLNANLNGAGFVGYRNDFFKISYETNPLGIAERNIHHFGVSVGFFTGFGNTLVSPTTTGLLTESEYDGFVWSKGFAGIFAINNVTLGIALGFDNLLDKNDKIWLYEGKPWLGLAFGLNLN